MNPIIFPISGTFCPGTVGVAGLASVVSLVWRKVNTQATIASTIFFVPNLEILNRISDNAAIRQFCFV